MENKWTEFSKGIPNIDRGLKVIVAYRDYPGADLDYHIMVAEDAYDNYLDLMTRDKYVAWKYIDAYVPDHAEYKECNAVYVSLDHPLSEYKKMTVGIPYFEKNFFEESISGAIKIGDNYERCFSSNQTDVNNPAESVYYIVSPGKFMMFIDTPGRTAMENFKRYVSYQLSIADNTIDSYKQMYDSSVRRKDQYQEVLKTL